MLSSSLRIMDHIQVGTFSESRDVFKFWQVSDSISETLQDRDNVTMED